MAAVEFALKLVLSCRPRHSATRAATLAAAPGDGHDGEDHLSALPDDLLRNIISRLPAKEAARTAGLARLWRPLWRSTPLVLYDKHIPAATERQRVATINRVLASHPGPIRTVHLVSFNLKHHEPELAELSQILADRNVEELVLITRPLLNMDNELALPADILRCRKLRRLYLGFWAFPDTTNLPGGLGDFRYLEEIAILNTHIEDRDLGRILASSPALKKLALAMTYNMPENVRLRGEKLECAIFCSSEVDEITVEAAPCLERLVMWNTFPLETLYAGVRIAGTAPALKVLGYLKTSFHELRFGDKTTVIKVEASTNPSPSSRVPSVKILAIKVDFSVFSEVQMLHSFLRCFPSVETLHVEVTVFSLLYLMNRV